MRWVDISESWIASAGVTLEGVSAGSISGTSVQTGVQTLVNVLSTDSAGLVSLVRRDVDEASLALALNSTVSVRARGIWRTSVTARSTVIERKLTRTAWSIGVLVDIAGLTSTSVRSWSVDASGLGVTVMLTGFAFVKN